ncbi:acyl-CoA thioesterase [Abyssibacter profundi]|uniref:Thioesterase n=1 Tax=Abyssibacter profundi TaxID=2182787 RepID=A0A363UPM2_9GAMM|nr:thioesterase family protein [Abyssibacter profundi]MBV62642.1 thioesterase [Nevskiales bacterium]PWN57421.1 thioesterase [Abyssibacter profundi]
MPTIERSRDDYRYWYPIQIRWGDMDALGHVNNARYFTFSESARLAYRDDNFPRQALPDSQDLILARTSCDFVEQLKYPDDLDAGCRIAKLGRSSLVFEVGMFRRNSERLVAVTEAVTVWFDYAAQQTTAIPDVLRDALLAYEPGLGA